MTSFRITLTTVLAAAAFSVSAGTALAFDDIYVRGEIGGSLQNSDSASWTTPGDEFQTMNLDTSRSLGAGVAVGGYVMPNIRGDLSYTFLGGFDLDSCRIPPGNGDCGESHNTGSVNTHLFLLNGFLEAPEPFMVGSTAVTPFLTAGIGAALHDFGAWNHMGLGQVGGPFETTGRDFYGANTWDFAWSAGAGASIDVSNAMNRPAFMDVTWRYTDAGTASGSTEPMPGSGGGIPVDAYNADVKSHSIFVGLRIPLGK